MALSNVLIPGMWWTSAFIAAAFFVTDHHFRAPDEWNFARSSLSNALVDRLEHGQRHRQIAFISLIALVGFVAFAARSMGPVKFPSVGSPPMLFFALWYGWCALSVVWSRTPLLTVRRIIPSLMVALCGVVVGSAVTALGAATLIGAVSLVFLCIGALNEALRCRVRKRRVWRFAGTLHPNQQGLVCAALLLCVTCLFVNGLLPVIGTGLLVAVSALALSLTRSRSALASVFVAMAIGAGICSIASIDRGAAAFTGAALAIAAAAAVITLTRGVPPLTATDVVAEVVLLGRRSERARSLTGRVALWRYVLRSIRGHLLLGMGYGSFWHASRAREVEAETGWRFGDCHSVYLEALTGTGVIGVALFVAMIGSALVCSLHCPARENASLAVFFALVVVHACSESTFVVPNFFSMGLAIQIGVVSRLPC